MVATCVWSRTCDNSESEVCGVENRVCRFSNKTEEEDEDDDGRNSLPSRCMGHATTIGNLSVLLSEIREGASFESSSTGAEVESRETVAIVVAANDVGVVGVADVATKVAEAVETDPV